ncbi:N-acetylneuraminate synthase [Gramella sp. KN1008]|uniref:N-acetylneuraminate synthase n=1 Tax=Gramella sp. KN1008 TaxID=2529298 RepID=UPI00103EBAD9|nr:N-acetylneuraminate synthase [Gramella sp. KN1008]TBW26612.1 N-acetylneuraminate synthase [Gramella sp. KN1008]
MRDKVLIIAEAGVNHNGDIEKAKQLIDAAVFAGVDYVKFQTFKADKIVTKSAERASYQNQNTGNKDSQYEMLKKLELSEEDHRELIKYCEARNVQFLSTGFDLDSLEFLYGLGIQLFKIPSGEITNLPYLKKIASFGKPIVMSTGMADMEEVEDALEVLIGEGLSKDNITVVHCNTEYPTPMEDVNLRAMNSIGKQLGVNIGYSDHTLGIEVPIAAVALGASVIEKHFTLDRNEPGPDHRASLEPKELEEMVKAIRNIELAISGDGIKSPSKSEMKNKSIVRKSIVANTEIKKGEIFTEKNLAIKRPGTGISPMKWDEILGKNSEKHYSKDDLI